MPVNNSLAEIPSEVIRQWKPQVEVKAVDETCNPGQETLYVGIGPNFFNRIDDDRKCARMVINFRGKMECSNNDVDKGEIAVSLAGHITFRMPEQEGSVLKAYEKGVGGNV
jgi:hypothetical protein